MPGAGEQIAEVALEHARLALRIRDVRDGLARGLAWPALAAELDDAIKMLRDHFVSEEALMASRGYPEQQHHAAQHQGILERLMTLRRECDARETELLPVLLDSLQSMVDQHEATSDAAFERYIASLG